MKTNYKITIASEGLSLYDYLRDCNLGKDKITKLFYEKNIFLNDEPASKSQTLHCGDRITIDSKEERDFLPDKKKLDVLYEDDYLLIVNKPVNILVHPDSKEKQGTMCNIISYYYQNKGLNYSIKYAHRLDMETTGILLFAKDSLTLAKLGQLIATHELKRIYLCLCKGRFSKKKGIIDAPIGEDRHHQQRKRISKTGKPAITHYEVVKEYKEYSLVRVQLETGRTHQIRVHLSSIGHPLLGDELYGGNKKVAKRVMLHSYQVSFIHPITKENIELTKPVPYDMNQLL